MKPGDLVELPDGRVGYYQGRSSDGRERVSIVEEVLCLKIKPYRPPEWKRVAKDAL